MMALTMLDLEHNFKEKGHLFRAKLPVILTGPV